MVPVTCVGQAVFKLLHLSHQKTKAHRQIFPALIPQSSEGGTFVLMDVAQESSKENGHLDGC